MPLPDHDRQHEDGHDIIPVYIQHGLGIVGHFHWVAPSLPGGFNPEDRFHGQEVSPAGTVILDQLVRQGLPWGEDASSLGHVEPSQETLSGWGLLRPGSDFIGARALSGQR